MDQGGAAATGPGHEGPVPVPPLVDSMATMTLNDDDNSNADASLQPMHGRGGGGKAIMSLSEPVAAPSSSGVKEVNKSLNRLII